MLELFHFKPCTNNQKYVLIRVSKNTISQVGKRLAEYERAHPNPLPSAKTRQVPKISTSKKDSCFLLRSNEFAFVEQKTGVVILGSPWMWLCAILLIQQRAITEFTRSVK